MLIDQIKIHTLTFDHSLRTLENTLDYAKEKKLMLFICLLAWFMEILRKMMLTKSQNVIQLEYMAALKLAGEIIIKSYNQVFDLPYTIIRPSALYGERCVSRRVGQIFIENAIQGLDININGNGRINARLYIH
jgi:dTDP-D-glucose 4,6-dehydratase